MASIWMRLISKANGWILKTRRSSYTDKIQYFADGQTSKKRSWIFTGNAWLSISQPGLALIMFWQRVKLLFNANTSGPYRPSDHGQTGVIARLSWWSHQTFHRFTWMLTNSNQVAVPAGHSYRYVGDSDGAVIAITNIPEYTAEHSKAFWQTLQENNSRIPPMFCTALKHQGQPLL